MGRYRRTLGRKKRDTDYHEEDYRYPPKPDPYYDVKEKGQCRWCGDIINNERGERNMRASWHPECSEKYLMIYNSKHIRKYIKKRDYCECALCGDYDVRFEIDHIKPLYEQKDLPAEQIDWSYWDEKNLQTLCRKCHKEKTKNDMIILRDIKKNA
jgi:hypothetical protein